MSEPKKKRGNPNWIKGHPSSNPNGRPPAGQSMAETLRRMLEQVVIGPGQQGRSKKEILADTLFKKATEEGDVQAARLIISYTDGQPPQEIKHSGSIGNETPLGKIPTDKLKVIRQIIIESSGDGNTLPQEPK